MSLGIPGDLLAIVVGIVAAALGAILGEMRGRHKQKRESKLEMEAQAHEERIKREAAAREAVTDGRNSGLSNDERVRRNRDKWSGM